MSFASPVVRGGASAGEAARKVPRPRRPVQIHTGGAADRTARREGMRGWASGADIGFAAGAFRPGTLAGDALIAHELAHAAQYHPTATPSPNPELEVEANQIAFSALLGETAPAPRHRTGLAIHGCGGPSEEYEQTKAKGGYHGVGGWLHAYVYEPLQEGYNEWIWLSHRLAEDWGDEVPILGHAAGATVGFVPWVLGMGGKLVVGIPQFLTPKSQEEHFLAVMTAGMSTPSVRITEGMRYGAWWVRNLFARKPRAHRQVLESVGEEGVETLVKKAGERCPTAIKQVPAKAETTSASRVASGSRSADAPAADSGLGAFGKVAPPPTGPHSEALKLRYLRNLESRWFKTKLKAYARLTNKGEVDFEGLARMVKTAEFREYANARQALQSGGFAGYSDGVLTFAMARPLRRIPILGNSAMQHEIVHVYQELTMQTLSKEASGNLPYGALLKAEVAANFFGSPAVILTYSGVVFGISGGTLYMVANRH